MKIFTAIWITALLAIVPFARAQTAGQDYTNGINDLAVTNLAAANTNFANAVALAPTNAVYNTFYAMTRFLTLPDQPAGSNFLTRIGVGSAGRNIYDWQATKPTNAQGHLAVATAAPPLNADDFTAQLRTNVLSVIIAAQTNLAQVTDTNFTLDLTTNETHESDVTLDWGDVQMLQAMCQTAEVFIYTTYSWNLNVQLNIASNYFGENGSYQALLANFPSALTTASTADLPAARGAFTNAISNYLAASQFIRNRPPGENRLFNLDPARAHEEMQFRQTLSNLLTSLSGPVALTVNPNYIVSAQAFFGGSLDLRAYLPQFQSNEFVWGSFPDLTFGGVITGLTQLQVGEGFAKPFQSVLDLAQTSLSVLYNFTNYSFQSGVVQGTNGNLYGVLAAGGPFVARDSLNHLGFGSVFEVTNGQLIALYNFGSVTNADGYPLDGAYPNPLTLGMDGNFYGTTQVGGTNSDGTFFRITPSGQFTVLYNFGAPSDAMAFDPAAALVQGSDGRFYGTTEYGGPSGAGTIFSIDTNGVCTNLYSFTGGSDGGHPSAPLLRSGAGSFYGTTAWGGTTPNYSPGYGTVFEINPLYPGQVYTLHTFGSQTDAAGNPLDGATPNGLIEGSDGNFYGTTQYGGSNDNNLGANGGFSGDPHSYGDGVLFRLTPGGSFSALYSFDEKFSDGYQPIGSLVRGPSGSFYGVASGGGANNRGAIFVVTASQTVTNVVWLDNATGDYGGNLQNSITYYESIEQVSFPNPVPSLLSQGLDGSLYGVTTDGGSNGSGTIYKLNLSNIPVVTWFNPAPISYGAPLTSTQLNATADIPGTFAYNPPSGTVLNIGTYLLSVVFTPNDLVDYTRVTNTVTLVVATFSTNVVFVRSSIGDPWGEDYELTSGTDEDALAGAFGTNWQTAFFETVNAGSLFSSSNSFIFMDGSDDGANAMSTFLNANLALIENWVNAGGSLFLNAAPNQGGDINFGFGVTLNYASFTSTAQAVNPSAAIFNGPDVPVGTTWSGDYFGHGTVTGPGLNPLIENTVNNLVVLAETSAGQGHVLFGGMTLPYFHSPALQSSNLLVNILSYGAGQADQTPKTTPIILWGNPASIVYGSSLTSTQLDATETPTISGTFTYSPPVGTVLYTGTNTLSVTFTPTDTAHYNSATTNVTIVVLPRSLTVRAADATWIIGQPYPAFTGTIMGLVNGDSITAVYVPLLTAPGVNSNSIQPILVDPYNLESNYVVTQLNGTLTAEGVAVVAPANGSSFTTNQSFAFTASAYWSNGIYCMALYTNSVQAASGFYSTNLTTVLSNLPAGSYHLTAVATNDSYMSFTSGVVYITVNVPGTALINFDPLDTSGNVPVTDAPLTTYLEQYGVTVTSVSPGTAVAVENEAGIAGGASVLASSQPNVLTQIGSNGPVSFTLSFAAPLSRFSFTRPELLITNGFVTHPAWQVQAFDSLGTLLVMTNAAQIASSTNVPAQTYTLDGGGIASIQFNSQGSGLTTFNAMLLDDFVLTAGLAGNVPPAVILTSPTNGQVIKTAVIPLAVETAAGIGSVTEVSFYYGANLIGSSQSSPFSVLWNAPSNGLFNLTAVAVNSGGLSRTSAVVSVTVATGFAFEPPPMSQTIALNGQAIFSAATTGTNVSYQWQFNGADINGATHSSYVVTNASLSASGNYTVVATSRGHSIASAPAVLTVLGPPTLGSPSITTNGGNIILSISASDAVPYYYQWQLNGNRIPGASGSGLVGGTTISYTLNDTAFNSGNYQVVVANAVASQESPLFNVVVSYGTPITTNDNFASSLTITGLTNGGWGVSGVNNSNSLPPADGPAQIAGKPAAGFLWYNWTASFSGVIALTTRGSSFDTLLGVYTGSALNNLTPVAQDDDSGGYFTSLVLFNCAQGTTYQIAVAGYQGAVGSVDLELSPGPVDGFPGPAGGYSVSGPEPVITQQPASQIVPAGATVTLSVTASNALGYQWYFTGFPVAGGTGSNLVISNFLASAAGNYSVAVSNAAGTVQSAMAAVQLATEKQNGRTGSATNLVEDKFGDAVDLTGLSQPDHYRPEDGGGETGGFTLSQAFSTVGATKEEGEPDHAGQPGGASYWYSYSAPGAGTLEFDTAGSTFNTILAIYTNVGPVVSFDTLTSVGANYTTNFAAQGQPVVTVSNVVGGTKFYIAIDGYLGASGAASLNVALTPLTATTNTIVVTNGQTVVAITAPANYSLASGSNLTVHGTIKGNGANRPAFTSMQVTVNGGAPQTPVLGPTNFTPVLVQTGGGVQEEVQETINWSLAGVGLSSGANLITAQSFDVQSASLETVSPLALRTVFYNATRPSPLIRSVLTLQTLGNGRITGAANNASLEIGRIYTVKAVPGAGLIFAGWNSGTNTNSLTEMPGTASLTFDMSSNLLLQATFVTNPFTAIAGVYNGLFSPASGVTEASSGFLTATLPATGHGAYTAKVSLDGGTYPFSGVFDLAGDAEQTVARGSKPPLTVNLHLDLNLPAPDDQLLGSVNNYATNGWTAPLLANRAVFNARNPAASFAGKYTLIIPPGSNAPVGEPGGYGYATLDTTAAGIASISGNLADKTPISQSVAVSQEGDIPLYISLYAHKGSLQGWLTVTNQTTNPPPMVLGTGVAWIKTNFNHTLYSGGFTNTNITVYGSPYVPQTALELTNGTLTISNGNLVSALIYSNLTLRGNDLVDSNAKTIGVITPGTGMVTVKFPNAGGGPETVAKGVILQDQTNAAGWFLGTDQSGFFFLQP